MDTQLEQPSFIEKGVAHVFRESEGRGHGKFFWELRPQTPSCFVNRSENLPGSAPVEVHLHCSVMEENRARQAL